MGDSEVHVATTAAGNTDLLLPAGTRLVHIGPSKTGTTAVQGAFHANRAATLAQGVCYAGSRRHSQRAAFAATGRSWQGSDVPPIGVWRALVAEIRQSREPRVVLSSEALAHASPVTLRRIVDDLDPARVHVVVTLRSLARIIPSTWQQSVQTGLATSYGPWLRQVLAPEARGSTMFWRRHRHDQLIARWADVVGPERMTAIVLDEEDRGLVLRTFERLLGLREGTLVAVPDLVNRSLTWPEVEAVRALGRAFRRSGFLAARYQRAALLGGSAGLKRRRPSPSEPRIETPQWALDRATEIDREIVAGIAKSGIRVVGDLESLAAPQVSRLPGDELPDVAIPPAVAAALALGLLGAALDGAGHAARSRLPRGRRRS